MKRQSGWPKHYAIIRSMLDSPNESFVHAVFAQDILVNRIFLRRHRTADICLALNQVWNLPLLLTAWSYTGVNQLRLRCKQHAAHFRKAPSILRKLLTSSRLAVRANFSRDWMQSWSVGLDLKRM